MSGEELTGGEQSPRRLSQIFEPLVEFHSKSSQATSPILSKISNTGSSGKSAKVNPTSSRLTSGSSSTPNSPR